MKPYVSRTNMDSRALEKKLSSVKETAEDIQGLSRWCLQHKNHHHSIIQAWSRAVRKAKVSHRLTLFYVCNDIVQNSRRKKVLDLVQHFATAIKEAAPLVRDEKIRQKILRIFNIWEERGIYDAKFVEELGEIVENVGTVNATENEVVLSSFQPIQLVEGVQKIQELQKATEFLLKDYYKQDFQLTEENVRQLRNTMKERGTSRERVEEFEESVVAFEAYMSSLQREVEERTRIITLLEQAEIFYETQRGEAKLVASAYKNFGGRVKTLKGKLEEKIQSLPSPSPCPSPSMDAPSPDNSDDEQLSLPEAGSSGNETHRNALQPPILGNNDKNSLDSFLNSTKFAAFAQEALKSGGDLESRLNAFSGDSPNKSNHHRERRDSEGHRDHKESHRERKDSYRSQKDMRESRESRSSRDYSVTPSSSYDSPLQPPKELKPMSAAELLDTFGKAYSSSKSLSSASAGGGSTSSGSSNTTPQAGNVPYDANSYKPTNAASKSSNRSYPDLTQPPPNLSIPLPTSHPGSSSTPPSYTPPPVTPSYSTPSTRIPYPQSYSQIPETSPKPNYPPIPPPPPPPPVVMPTENIGYSYSTGSHGDLSSPWEDVESVKPSWVSSVPPLHSNLEDSSNSSLRSSNPPSDWVGVGGSTTYQSDWSQPYNPYESDELNEEETDNRNWGEPPGNEELEALASDTPSSPPIFEKGFSIGSLAPPPLPPPFLTSPISNLKEIKSGGKDVDHRGNLVSIPTEKSNDSDFRCYDYRSLSESKTENKPKPPPLPPGPPPIDSLFSCGDDQDMRVKKAGIKQNVENDSGSDMDISASESENDMDISDGEGETSSRNKKMVPKSSKPEVPTSVAVSYKKVPEGEKEQGNSIVAITSTKRRKSSDDVIHIPIKRHRNDSLVELPKAKEEKEERISNLKVLSHVSSNVKGDTNSKSDNTDGDKVKEENEEELEEEDEEEDEEDEEELLLEEEEEEEESKDEGNEKYVPEHVGRGWYSKFGGNERKVKEYIPAKPSLSAVVASLVVESPKNSDGIKKAEEGEEEKEVKKKKKEESKDSKEVKEKPTNERRTLIETPPKFDYDLPQQLNSWDDLRSFSPGTRGGRNSGGGPRRGSGGYGFQRSPHDHHFHSPGRNYNSGGRPFYQGFGGRWGGRGQRW
ncbi:uncharacterized protein LOC143041079 [Oratosquilla oratoria]|uniref:uncharacterized protein LOC143041079 n=1 Tax=Oratosquilla oratoria TaxID=337810 RepID=UPI003F75B64B